MKRLTYKIASEVVDHDAEDGVNFQEIINKLGEYEDIGPTPEQLLEIDKMYLKKCEEVNRLKAQLAASREGDLISRNAVIELIWNLIEISEYDGDKILATKDDIENLSAAYDVDKVVEQLEDYLFDKYCVEGDGKISEILKEGGVDE